MELAMTLATISAVAFSLISSLMIVILCLKIKKGSKEFIGGMEGTLSPIMDIDEVDRAARATHQADPHTPRPPAAATQVPRPVSSTENRKLPDLPDVATSSASAANDDDKSSDEDDDEDDRDPAAEDSDMYATVPDSTAAPHLGDPALPDVPSGSHHRYSEGSEGLPDPAVSSNHPYAKVKKRRDHPYATVKKLPAPQPPSQPRPPSLGAAVNFHPLGAAAAAPMPPAPEVADPAPQQHFSGDSQDSSKGYTSISVREPLSHILPPSSGVHGVPPLTHPHPPPQPGGQYMAVSEASEDGMYAAIEDPSYIPTGTSQSNSDTYAVINLPEEEFEDDGAMAGASSSGPPTMMANHHMYSKIDKSKKTSRPQPPTPPPLQSVEDMYAKINKGGEVWSPVPPGPPSRLPRRNPEGGEPSPLPPPKRGTDSGYERVRERGEGSSPLPPPKRPAAFHRMQGSPLPPPNPPGSKISGSQWSESDSGYERVREPPGYETVTLPPQLRPGEPPYARLNESDDEEGYETIPPPPPLYPDPGYETVPDHHHHHQPTYSDPIDVVAGGGVAGNNNNNNNSTVVVIEHVGSSISMTSTQQGQQHVRSSSNELQHPSSASPSSITKASGDPQTSLHSHVFV